ncbi:flagellar basal body protein FliL [Treponema primitia]|uniref:flagellar basal body protein FliL n=1 Tax=Treponema primitia TaxID=88058 RepID=UPI000255518A|nr:flagellar basal body protein FliL [Treponema primitia]
MPRIEYRPSGPRSPERKSRPLLIFYRVLLVIVLFLVLVILGGSLYALILRPKAAASPPVSPAAPLSAGDANIFTGLGRLRCPTAAPNPGMVILQAAFPYYPGDRPFSEELVSRLKELRNISIAYFAALSVEELGRKSEAEIKAELLSRYNAILRLGQIEILYFNEYMLIE